MTTTKPPAAAPAAPGSRLGRTGTRPHMKTPRRSFTQHATPICFKETMRAKEVEDEARAEALRTTKNGMRVRRGECEKGRGRDRAGQQERKEALQRCGAERKIEWARKDALALLDGMGLQVLDRMLRTDEKRRAGASSDNEGKVVELAQQRSLTRFHPIAFSSSPGGDLRATPPPPSFSPSNFRPQRRQEREFVLSLAYLA